MLFKLLYLNSNFALTLGYLNRALNNPAQPYCKKLHCTIPTFESSNTKPKSPILHNPSRPIKMFAGLISIWTMLLSWRCLRPWKTVQKKGRTINAFQKELLQIITNERLFYCFGKPTNSHLTWKLKLNILTRLRSTRNSHTTVSLAESLFSR